MSIDLRARLDHIHNKMVEVKQNIEHAENGKWYGSRGEMNACYDAITLGEAKLKQLESDRQNLLAFGS